MKQYIFIDNNRQFLTWLEKFETRKKYTIALDLEANSNQHAYGYQLALIQINDGEDIIIIDPFKIKNGNLRKLFENRNIFKVMYDAGYDMHLLKNANGIELKSVYDLKPAVDILDYEKRDLHSIIFSELAIQLEQKRKYQTYNWLKRPIGSEALKYAANDVRYLLDVKDKLIAKVMASGRIDEYIHNNIRVQNKDYKDDGIDVHNRVKGFYQLSEDAKELFARLFYVRDKYARMVNMAAHNVINNKILLSMAEREVKPEELSFPKRMNKDIVPGILEELVREMEKEPVTPED